MTFRAIVVGLILFLVGLFVQVALWRLRRPRDDFRALALCLFVVPLGIELSLLAAGWKAPLTLREELTALALNVALAAIYIMYYPAAQAASPTMLVVVKIGRAGKKGISRVELMSAFDEHLMCRQGIDNLVHEHFADYQNGKLSIG